MVSHCLNSKKAFSLVELAVALVVIGILSSVAIPVTLAVSRNRKLQQTELELRNIRELIITFYNMNGILPPHTPDYKLPTNTLGLPEQYKNDPVKGVPYLYLADTLQGTDTIYVDGIPLGGISAVIISAGPNGKFDGENADPTNWRFQSVGTGDFDDLLYYLADLDLKPVATYQSTSTTYCPTLTLIFRNKNRWGRNFFLRPIFNTTPQTYTVTTGNSVTIPNLPPSTVVQICGRDNTFSLNRTVAFNLSAINEGNCTVEIVGYSSPGTALNTEWPYITGDLSR